MYSFDGSLIGYVNNSLFYFNIKDFSEMVFFWDFFKNLFYNKFYCRLVNNLVDWLWSRIFILRLLRWIIDFFIVLVNKKKDFL